MPVRVEWDSRKANSNLDKHNVSFDETSTVFDDPLTVLFDDKNHSTEEIREIATLHSVRNRLLVVSFTERAPDIIRIISARLATRKERKDYEENTR
jgi:uncharacterized DUF497 family protein